MAEIKKEIKSLLKVKEENEKAGLKLNIKKNKQKKKTLRSWHPGSLLHGK